MNNDTTNRRSTTGLPAAAAANHAFSTSVHPAGHAARRLLVLGAFSLAAAMSFGPAHALPPIKQKTTGSNIVRSVEKDAGDATQLEEVQVMIGAVLDARATAREARDEPSVLPDLPVLDRDAFLDDSAMAAAAPKH